MNQLAHCLGRYKHLIVGVAALGALLLYLVPFDAIYAELTAEQAQDVQNRMDEAHEQVDNTDHASDSRKAFEHDRINDQQYAILSARGNSP